MLPDETVAFYAASPGTDCCDDIKEYSPTATTVWSYRATPGIQNDLLGNLQRLPNGNTLIGYGTKSTLQEVSPDGILLREWDWPMDATFGYIQKRPTLYGPPPR